MLKVMLQSQHSIKQAQQKVGVKPSGVTPDQKSGGSMDPLDPLESEPLIN